MAGQPVRIGPFVGGLNNISTAGESKDEEVVDLVNFELALDTSLISRPPLVAVSSSRESLKWEILGVYRVTASDWYVIVQQPVGVEYKIRAYANGNFASVPIEIKTLAAGNAVKGYVQYNNYGYFLVNPNSSVPCFRWLRTGAATDIATMPKGTVLVSWKDRLWVTGSGSSINGNYIWFSTVDAAGPKPDTWATTDFINIDPGSGGLNTAMLPLTSTLLIFKEDATYRFGFPGAVKNGEVINVSRQIGAAGPNSVIGFENYCFVYDQGRIYELINTKFTQINLGVDFGKNAGINVDSTAPGVDISVVGRRLIVRYFTSLYVYSVDTRTWTQWQSFAGTPGKFVEMPGDSNSASPVEYYAASRGITQLAGENRIYDPLFVNDELSNKRSLPTAGGTVVFNNSQLTFTVIGPALSYINLTHSGMLVADIPVSANQKLVFSVAANDFAAVKYCFTKFDGTTETIEQLTPVYAGGIATFPSMTVPANAYMVAIQLGNKGQAGTIPNTMTASLPTLVMESVNSSTSVLKFTDGYLNTLPKEFIRCFVKTKAFDFQAGAIFKRLFLWGIDVVTPREISLQAIPLGRKASVTWDTAADYTWNQLAQGTWDNPLSWKGLSKTVTDVTDPFTDISDNGRFFVKVPKSLKFRQIQFSVELTTLGNLDSGPAKLFSLTTYTKAGAMVVDKAT